MSPDVNSNISSESPCHVLSIDQSELRIYPARKTYNLVSVIGKAGFIYVKIDNHLVHPGERAHSSSGHAFPVFAVQLSL